MATACDIPESPTIQLQYGSNLIEKLISSLPNDWLTFFVHPKRNKTYRYLLNKLNSFRSLITQALI